ncbi:adaptin, alpha/gamma/epsilon, putative [Entamoeba invadens IP1]|uniref:adaptin, alpha/gamma/epsilon, putative n=1 Tax=Entamoeba invadens IP1 TaxID=370355 RepID=UPI0002C3E348|nr:adaptin, alpha/gamma/epsilon, putative [Entamoeba invadens IP1]ELP93882.1 adaptin, alpha/gamma/epsilon, putative [Entamoeba invadens IP1]|eukprot:XP_004260653.1 adaptin, alpha/gamma/epsilon, putative [Entamoeba invadens IP1]
MKTFKDNVKSSIKLKALIRVVKNCKTAEEERKVITRECADIRMTMPDQKFKNRNVMKLIYLDLLGYNTQFAQIECLALISSDVFQTKRIGYLALGLLLDETQETLTLVINHLQKDLQSDNSNIVELALTTIANIGSEEVCQVVSPYVVKTFNSKDRNTLKKSVAAALRIVRKCPDLGEQYINPVLNMLKYTDGEFMLGATCLAEEIVKTPNNKISLINVIPTLVTILHKNFKGTFTDVGSQGFVCCNLIKLLEKLVVEKHILGFEEIIGEIFVSIPHSAIGIAVGLTATKSVFKIQCDEILKEMAINYLKRMVCSDESNSRYCSLRQIEEIIDEHKDKLGDMLPRLLLLLQDEDTNIQKLCLRIVTKLATPENVKEIVQSLILSLGEDEGYTKEASKKVSELIEIVSADEMWKFDCLLDSAMQCGEFLDDSITEKMISLVQASNIQTFATTKLFAIIQKSPGAVKRATIWCAGEYFDLLKEVIPEVKIIEEIMKSECDEMTVIVALLKIASRHSELVRNCVKNYVWKYKGGHSILVNQLCSELENICSGNVTESWGRMPVLKPREKYVEKKVLISLKDEKETKNSDILNLEKTHPIATKTVKFQNENDVAIKVDETKNVPKSEDILEIFNMAKNTQNLRKSTGSKYDILSLLDDKDIQKSHSEAMTPVFDLVGDTQKVKEPPNLSTEQTIPIVQETKNETILPEPQNETTQPETKSEEDDFEFTDYVAPVVKERRVEVFSNENVGMAFSIKRSGNGYQVVALFSNKTNENILNLQMRVAAPRGISIDIQPPDEEILKANTTDGFTQVFTTNGSVNGNVPVKAKVEYSFGGKVVTFQTTPVILNE